MSRWFAFWFIKWPKAISRMRIWGVLDRFDSFRSSRNSFGGHLKVLSFLTLPSFFTSAFVATRSYIVKRKRLCVATNLAFLPSNTTDYIHDMAKRISRTNRWNPRLWRAIEKIAKANRMGRAEFLEMCFKRYAADASGATAAELAKLKAEALKILESIEQDSKE